MSPRPPECPAPARPGIRRRPGPRRTGGRIIRRSRAIFLSRGQRPAGPGPGTAAVLSRKSEICDSSPQGASQGRPAAAGPVTHSRDCASLTPKGEPRRPAGCVKSISANQKNSIKRAENRRAISLRNNTPVPFRGSVCQPFRYCVSDASLWPSVKPERACLFYSFQPPRFTRPRAIFS